MRDVVCPGCRKLSRATWGPSWRCSSCGRLVNTATGETAPDKGSRTVIDIYWNEHDIMSGWDRKFVIRQFHRKDYYKVISNPSFRRWYGEKKLNGTALNILYCYYGDCTFGPAHWLENALPRDMIAAQEWKLKQKRVTKKVAPNPFDNDEWWNAAN
jgi:hypothetical protein